MADSQDTHAPRSPFRIWQAFQWSMKGLRAAWQVESSFRLEVYLCLVLVPLGLYLGQTGVERFLLVSVLLLVLIVEVLNSAIEAVVDRWGPEHHDLAGRAKDMGSAAVFLSDVNVVVCWFLILWPQWSKDS
jgi:diacylglycerol kinase (ATP)